MLDAEKELIEREPSLPGLALLLDADAMADRLADCAKLRGLDGLQIDYLRYKPGENCLARLQMSRDGRQAIGYAKAYRNDATEKLDKVRSRRALPGRSDPGTLVLDEARVVVRFLPSDAKLGSLGQLQDRDARDELLARLFRDASVWDGASCELLHYKPERRFVARLWVDGGAEATIKFYAAGDFGPIRKFHKRFQPPDSVALPRWIGGSKSHRVLAFSWLSGSPVTVGALRENPSLAGLAGHAVAHFHEVRQPWLKPPKHGRVERRLAGLASEHDFLLGNAGRDASTLAKRLYRWLQGRPSGGVPLHGDFHASQVILNDDGAGLIDFDKAHRGEAGRDLGNFLAHLEYDVLRGKLTSDERDAVRAALVDGYRAVRPQEHLPELEGHMAAGLFDLLHAPFRYREPDWPQLSVAIVRRCGELLADSGRVEG